MRFSYLSTSWTSLPQRIGHGSHPAGTHIMLAFTLPLNNDTTSAAHAIEAGTANIPFASYFYAFQHGSFSEPAMSMSYIICLQAVNSTKSQVPVGKLHSLNAS